MHFVNNGSIVLIASIPALRAWLEDGGEAPPWVLLAPALLAVVMGVRLLSGESNAVTAGSDAARHESDAVRADSDAAKAESEAVKAESDDMNTAAIAADPSR